MGNCRLNGGYQSMAIEYACFMSYRHGEGELTNNLIDELYKALSDELEPYFGKGSVYLDKERLETGDFFNEAISSALYHSVCLIAVYTPTYFDRKYTYCAWEYKAMERLEKERLKLLNTQEKKHGLIIPIVFRGCKYLPQEIKERRQYFDFENFLLCDGKMNRHPRYAPAIKKIAEYIADRYNTFAKLDDSLFDNRENFSMPKEKEIKDWLKDIASPWIPFPGREESII
jgi:hypothetical protein